MFFLSFFDFPEPAQLLFQDPASPSMYFIIGAHNTIIFYLFVIVGLVIVLMLYIVSSGQPFFHFDWFVSFNNYNQGFSEFFFMAPNGTELFESDLNFFNSLDLSDWFSFLKSLLPTGSNLLIPYVVEWTYFNHSDSSIFWFGECATEEISSYFFSKGFFDDRLVSLSFISNRFQKWYEQNLLETFWTEYPSVLVALLVIPVLIFLFVFEEVEVGQWSFIVKVIGNQWFWSYEFVSLNGSYDWLSFFNPDLLISSPKVLSFESRMVSDLDLVPGQLRLLDVDKCLVLPVHVPVHLYVTSVDVIHSWSVPSLGVKIDAVPGRLNAVSFVITRPGVFYGQCSELCGVNHFAMPIKVVGIFHEYLL